MLGRQQGWSYDCLDPDSTCHRDSVLPLESCLIRRKRHNLCPVATSPPQTHLHQSSTRHCVLIGHLPLVPSAGIMYEALSKALWGKALDSGLRGRIAPYESPVVG
jgi:hypothetical protein